jgi:nucleotide-binding universal stress UspA family protein
MFKRILHPTDFSPVANQAFEQALALAKRYDAKLRLMHASTLQGYDESVVPESLKGPFETIQREFQKRLEQLVSEAPESKERFETIIRSGRSPSECVLDDAEAWRADLIVMGTHGGASMRRLLLGSVAERVLRQASCPVMVLGRAEDEPARFDNVLVPVDFSPTSARAAGLGLALALEHDATLHVVHVCDDYTLPPYAADEQLGSCGPEVRARGKEALSELIRRLGAEEKRTGKYLLDGPVSPAILDFVDRASIDVVVMGTAGLSGFRRMLLGSVAAQVMRDSSVPVITVRAS